jgi:benzoyl-CoA reductase subunit B
MTKTAERQAAPHAELIGATRKESRRLMEGWWQGLSASAENGRPAANVFVMGSAAEILRTFDIVACFPEITALQTAIKGRSMDYLVAAEDYGYSPDICGYVKVDVGMHLKEGQHPLGLVPKPSLVIASNMCNTYIKWAEIWERLYGCPVVVLDLPGWRGTGFVAGGDGFESDRRYVEGQLRELIGACERITGRKLDIDRLRETMLEVNRLSELYQAVLAENRHRPAPFNAMLDGVNYMGIANAYRGSADGVRFMQIALDELRERVRLGIGAVPDERFRLLFVGTTCYTHFLRFLELFQEWGGVFVLSEYMTFAAGGIDKGIFYDTDRPLESLAEQILLSSQRSMSGIFHSQDWHEQVVRDYHVHGICFHGVKSCRTVSTGLPDLREWHMRKSDTPGLFVQSDLVDTRLWSEAQMKNRIDAFFEALESRRLAKER